MPRKLVRLMLLILVAAVVAPVAAQDDEFVFGLVLVGPENDGGWSQAHYEGGLYVQEQVPGSKMIFRAALTPGDPVATLESVVSDMVADGAKLIITASDAFEEDTAKVAADPAFADVVFINVSGDDAYAGSAGTNVGNVMGQMEWGKMIAGCAAALATETGSIGYLGPLINGETRRLASSAYLGARHCYETYVGGDPDALEFNVVWIGFWFYNPAFNTLDPTEVANNFFDSGADVVLSGIDTTEAIVVADQRTAEAQGGSDPTTYYAVPYDFAGACDLGPTVCLGVPYFNWGPAYVNIVNAVKDGSWTPSWDWLGPDWSDINNIDTSTVGFVQGPALSDEDKASLDAFIAELAAYASDPANKNTFFLWEGPLSYQDGTEIATEGEKLAAVAPLGEAPSVWYLDQLLAGMGGDSN